MKAGLVALSTAIDELQAHIQRAEATPAAPETTNGNGNGNGAVTFAELGARVQQHDAEAELLRSLVRQRLDELEPHAKPVPGPGPAPATPKGPARTFTLSKTNPMKGADVKAFQRLLNLRFDAWKIDRRIAELGVYDAETREAARQVTQALGLLPQAYEHGITPALRSVIRTPSRRTPTQTKRGKARAPYRAKLRARYGEKPAATVATAASASVPAGAFMGSNCWRSRSPRSATASGSRPRARSARTPTRLGRAATTTSATRTRTRTTSPTAARRRPGWTRPRSLIMHQLGFKDRPAQGADQHLAWRHHDRARRPPLPRAGDLPRLRARLRRQPPQPRSHRRQARRSTPARPRRRSVAAAADAPTASWSRA